MAGRPRKNNVSMEEMIKHQEDAVEKAADCQLKRPPGPYSAATR